MGKELEYKLHIENQETLSQILCDPRIVALATEPLQETKMKTTYYDTAERLFSAHRFTLRQRFEGTQSVICLKTPLKESHTRGEWQILADRIDQSSIDRLIDCGAPVELAVFFASGQVGAICGAEFLRKHVLLHFADGSSCEIAGDCGILHGETEEIHFVELELELQSGEKDEMLALVAYLCEKYHLREEPLSKFARARMLK